MLCLPWERSWTGYKETQGTKQNKCYDQYMYSDNDNLLDSYASFRNWDRTEGLAIIANSWIELDG